MRYDQVLKGLHPLILRYASLGLVALLIASTVGVVVARASEEARVVEAEAFYLRDKDGVVRVALGTNDSNDAFITFANASGTQTAWITVAADGGATMNVSEVSSKSRTVIRPGVVSTNGGDGQRGAEIGVIATDTPAVVLRDATGDPRVELRIDPDNCPEFALYSPMGTPAVCAGASDSGASLLVGDIQTGPSCLVSASPLPSVSIVDSNGLNRVAIGIREDGAAGLTVADDAELVRGAFVSLADSTVALALYDETGRPRVVANTLKTGASGVVGLDSNGRPRAQLGVKADQTPMLQTMDESNVLRFTADGGFPAWQRLLLRTALWALVVLAVWIAITPSTLGNVAVWFRRCARGGWRRVQSLPFWWNHARHRVGMSALMLTGIGIATANKSIPRDDSMFFLVSGLTFTLWLLVAGLVVAVWSAARRREWWDNPTALRAVESRENSSPSFEDKPGRSTVAADSEHPPPLP